MNMKRIFLIWMLGLQLGSLPGQVMTMTGYYARVGPSGTLPPELNTYIDGIATMYYTLPDRKVNGSPYLQEEFMFGIMKTVDTVTIEGLKYRYDIFNDEMQFILKGDTASIIRPLTLRSIELGKVKFIYDVYFTANETAAAGYFEILQEGKLTALIRRVMKLEYDEYLANYAGGGGSKEYIFKEKKSLYVKYGNAIARKVSKKRDFLAVIPDHHEALRLYMKSNKLLVRKPDHLLELVNYYNKLEYE